VDSEKPVQIGRFTVLLSRGLPLIDRPPLTLAKEADPHTGVLRYNEPGLFERNIMEKSVAGAVQMAHYWKFKKPLDYLEASKVANEVISQSKVPDYLSEWLDEQKAKRNESHPIVRFLLSVRKKCPQPP